MTKFFKFLLLIIFSTTMISCGEDDNSPQDNDLHESIIGIWYGIRSYNNPVSGIQYQFLTVTFDSNGLGNLEYESPTSYSVATFTYSIQGNSIVCHGAYANSDGDWSADFDMTLKIEGDRLIPTDKYTMFILTKDGSVETDGNGEEIIDDSQLIYGVWIHSSGERVLVLDHSNFTEYTLLPNANNVYAKKTEGEFSYNYRDKYVRIRYAYYDVIYLSDSSLSLRSQTSNKIYNYTRGTETDIPSNGEGIVDYKTLLELPPYWSTSKSDRTIRFSTPNQVIYLEHSSKSYGSWGHLLLNVEGTYWISGKDINCVFKQVKWEYGDSGGKDYFPGWEYGQDHLKVFTIENISTESMKLKFDDGNSYYFYPLY